MIGLVWLLIYALIICVICWIVTRLVAQFAPGGAGYAWIVWAIGGLILLILALRLVAAAVPGP